MAVTGGSSVSSRLRARSSYLLEVCADLAMRGSRRVGAGRAGETLSGDRWVEWAFCIARLPDGPARTLDFGADTGFLSMAAALRGHSVTALDLQPAVAELRHPAIEVVQADILDWQPAVESFDVVINCSSVEHVGLTGRYESAGASDGDLLAVGKLAQALRRGGRMIATVPVGVDGVYPPRHRVYGEQRLPKLLEPFEVGEEQYWIKRDGCWRESDRVTALATPGSESFYALGLFVLTRKAP
jgi:SAM-dependent methyltransferase